MKPHGFTLLEVLLGVFVIALVVYLAGSALRNSRQEQALAAATRQVVGGLERTRSNALKYSQNSSFTLTSNTTYTVPANTSTQSETLPEGVVVGFCQDSNCTTTTPTGTVSYLSPNAEVPAGNYALKVQFQNRTRYIKIIGVIGKVVESATL